MKGNKLKVVWVCGFSNAEVRSQLSFEVSWFRCVLRKMFRDHSELPFFDFALWNTRGIEEFKHFEDVELHVISHANYLSTQCQSFQREGIFYYFYRDESDNLIYRFLRSLIGQTSSHYVHSKGDRIINEIIKRINPDVIHLIGAENFYSTFVLKRDNTIPVIVHLQDLLCTYDVEPAMSMKSLSYRSRMERKIIRKCDYVGTESVVFRDFIKKNIDPKAVVINMDLATGVPIVELQIAKEYDFVYFANGISKACDLAIEAFALLIKKFPQATLDVIGGFSVDYKENVDKRINELGLSSNVFFEGKLPSHDDVMMQIRKARFALLPFKLDYSPTTIPEAMSCGLPVVSTNTEGIAILYHNNVDTLLSDIGDHSALAFNMERLMVDDALGNKLRENAYRRLREDNNTARMRCWVSIYRAIVENMQDGKKIPESFLL